MDILPKPDCCKYYSEQFYREIILVFTTQKNSNIGAFSDIPLSVLSTCNNVLSISRLARAFWQAIRTAYEFRLIGNILVDKSFDFLINASRTLKEKKYSTVRHSNF